MNVRNPLVFSIAFLVLACVLIGNIPGHESTAVKMHAPDPPRYIAYLDPVTGELTSSPNQLPSSQIDTERLDFLTTSSAGLVEEASPVAGGGIMVNLQGRFQNVFVAALGDSGEITAACKSGASRRHADGGGSQ